MQKVINSGTLILFCLVIFDSFLINLDNSAIESANTI